MPTKTDPVVSARTLRRTERKLAIELDALRNQILAQRSETGERLAEIERLLSALTDCLRIPLLPRWTRAEQEAFERGEAERDAATDARMRKGFKELAARIARENGH